MPSADLPAALTIASRGSIPAQIDAVPTLVRNLGAEGVESALMGLLRHPANLGPICAAARELLRDGTDVALSIFADAWYDTEIAEDWQSADCLADAAAEAMGNGIGLDRWKALAERTVSPTSEGAQSVYEWLTDGVSAPRVP